MKIHSLQLTAASLLSTLALHSTRADALDDLLSAELQKRHLPGLSVAVVRDGQVVKTAAQGFANLELGVDATPKTVFQIQSITKTFTAAFAKCFTAAFCSTLNRQFYVCASKTGDACLGCDEDTTG